MGEEFDFCAEYEKVTAKTSALERPVRPGKPTRRIGENNAEFGKRLDEYEDALDKFKVAHKEYCAKVAAIEKEYEERVIEAVGLKGHAKLKSATYFISNNMSVSNSLEWANAMEDLAALIL